MIPRFKRTLPSVCLTVVLTLISGGQIFSQGDGTTLQEKPGVALIKPQAWSKEVDATVTEFRGFIDRTAGGGGGAGYYEIYTTKGQKRQVEAAKIVKIVIYPDADKIPDLKDSDTREKVNATMAEITEVMRKFPATKTYIQPYITKLQTMVARYDGGEVKVEGEWMSKTAHSARQAEDLKTLLVGDIIRAQPPGSFDLVNDPRYQALQEMAQGNPSVQKLLTEVEDRQAASVRSEKRKTAVAKLKDASLSRADAQALIDEIKAQNADEDAVAKMVVGKWNKALETEKQLQEESAELAAEMEKEMAAVQPDTVPVLSEGLQDKLSPFSQKVAIFFATQPPVQITADLQQARALERAYEDLRSLQILFPAKQYLEAKSSLDELSRQAESIGPETAKVVGALQKLASSKVDEFSRMRNEAQLLLDSGEKEKAVAKYEEAFAVVADAGVGEQIKLLKGETAGEAPAASPAQN